MNIYLYLFILTAGIFLTPFVFYFLGLKRSKKISPLNYCKEANQKLEKSFKEQLQYP